MYPDSEATLEFITFKVMIAKLGNTERQVCAVKSQPLMSLYCEIKMTSSRSNGPSLLAGC